MLALKHPPDRAEAQSGGVCACCGCIVCLRKLKVQYHMESAIIQIDRKCKYIATNGSGRSHDAGNTGIMPQNAADKVTSRKRNSYNLVKNIEKIMQVSLANMKAT
jgi:hypothetical protein